MSESGIAVIVTCYNSEKYLAGTIDSVLAQNCEHVHLIAGNDNSTDKTAEILESYGNRITVVRHDDNSNHGQAATINLCLRYANAEYIAFIDHDDLWHPDKLRKQSEILDKHPDVGLVYTNGNVIDDNDNILYPLLPSNHSETNETGSILINCYIRTPSVVMVRGSVLKTIGGFKEGIIADQDMWVRIQEVSKLYFINEPLTSYRVHYEQTSNISNNKMWKDAFQVLNSAVQRYPYSKSIIRKRRAVIHYRLGKNAMNNRKYLRASYHFSMSCLNDPYRAIISMKRILQ